MEMEAATTAQTNGDGTTVLVCQCSNTGFREGKRTKKAVVFQCIKCGAKTSVQGNATIANLRAGFDEVRLAAEESVIIPLGNSDDKPNKPNKENGADDSKPAASGKEVEERVMLRSSIPKSAFKNPIWRAFELIRILNCDQEKFRKQEWVGYALELICAEFIAGVDPRALIIWDAMNEESERRSKEAMLAKGRQLTKRTLTRIQNATRDQMSEELGLFGSQEEEDSESENVNKTKLDEDGMFLDDLVLRKSVIATLNEYSTEFQALYGERLSTGVADTIDKLYETWNRNGGYMLRIKGDPRTKDPSGGRPVVYAWLISESERLNLDFCIAYEDALDDILNLSIEVTEILPTGYGSFSKDEQWDIPACATGREEIEEA